MKKATDRRHWVGSFNKKYSKKAPHTNRLKVNLNIFDFELDEKDMQKIDELHRHERLVNPGREIDWEK